MDLYTIETSKEALGFSAAHIATFADGTAERLHGHNYRVSARVSGGLDPAGMVMDVCVLKQWVRELCDELDHLVLLPSNNPDLPVETSGDSIQVRAGEKAYLFPASDCALLPVPNTTMEHLARYLADRLCERLRERPEAPHLRDLRVSVSEAPGQSASWTTRISGA